MNMRYKATPRKWIDKATWYGSVYRIIYGKHNIKTTFAKSTV